MVRICLIVQNLNFRQDFSATTISIEPKQACQWEGYWTSTWAINKTNFWSYMWKIRMKALWRLKKMHICQITISYLLPTMLSTSSSKILPVLPRPISTPLIWGEEVSYFSHIHLYMFPSGNLQLFLLWYGGSKMYFAALGDGHTPTSIVFRGWFDDELLTWPSVQSISY